MPTPSSNETKETTTISVVIPVWRDHGMLAPLLSLLQGSPTVSEVIVCVAEPALGIESRLVDLGARIVTADAPSRGRQLDLGARQASGEWLLFHHADTNITHAHLEAVATLDGRAFVGGAFYRQFDERHPRLRWLEGIERWHNRHFGPLFGDQSIFARREAFHALGGFRGLPLMEDVDFSLRLRRFGRVALLDPPIATSPRKHLAQGPWRTTLINAALLGMFRLGVPAARLHRWYYSGPLPDNVLKPAIQLTANYP
jgi:hypothetical protein